MAKFNYTTEDKAVLLKGYNWADGHARIFFS